MRARWLTFALPLVLLACKKEAPAPSPAPAISNLGAASAAPSAAPKGEGLAILKDFEGQISWVLKGKLAGPAKDGGAPLNLALLVKGGKFRLDLPAGLPGAPPVGKAYLLGNPQAKQFHAVMDSQKQAILIDVDRLGAQLDMAGGGASAPGAGDDAPTVKKTGKADTVAGYSCEIWEMTHKTSRMELCIAAEKTAWFQLPIAKMPAKYAWASELTDGTHFPLRFVAFDKGGAEEGRVELTGIEKKTLAAEGFEVPAGYQVIDVKQMMAGLGMGLSGMHGRPGTPNLAGLQGLPKGVPSSFVAPKPAAKKPPDPKAKK